MLSQGNMVAPLYHYSGQAPNLGSQGHVWSENDAIMSWLRLIPVLAQTLDTTPILFEKMRLQLSFKLQYGTYGCCSFSPRGVLYDIGRNTPASIP
jgi:hypothetical protein